MTLFLNAQLNVWREVTLQLDWNRAALAHKERTKPSTRSGSVFLAHWVLLHGAEVPVDLTIANLFVREDSFPKPDWPLVSPVQSDSISRFTVRNSVSVVRDGHLTQPELEPSIGWSVLGFDQLLTKITLTEQMNFPNQKRLKNLNK